VFRYSVAGAVILVVGFILGFRPQGGAPGVLAAMALVLVFSFALSWLWIVVGMLVRTPESVMTTSFVFLMPLTFASDIFVGLATMPAWLQGVVRHNPVTHLANASRDLMHGRPAGADASWTLLASLVIVAAVAPLAMRLYRKER
jgi:ABC-2 type transport system permease protein